MKVLSAILLLIMLVGGSFAQRSAPVLDLSNYGVRIEPDRRLLLVLATLEMANTLGPGDTSKLINTPLSEKGTGFRERLLADNADLNADLRQRISQFVTQFKKRHPKYTDAEIVSPFISMAYALSPAPEMADPVYTADLPGPLLDVLDFAPLVREFYRRSTVATHLDNYMREYVSVSDAVLRSSTREMVGELLAYMHTRPQVFYTEKRTIQGEKTNSKKTVLQKTELIEHERRFYVVPEMLAPTTSINFLNVKDDYYVILPPDKDVSNSDVRRAFLQFVIDPMVLANSKDISLISSGVKAILDERRKIDPSISPDVFLTISRSLVSAIDAKQNEFVKSRIATDLAREKIDKMKSDDERRAVSAELARYKQSLADDSALLLSEAYESGAVLSFYFAEQLAGVENSGFDIASSVREMIASFEPANEKDRLARNADAAKRALAAREARRSNPITPEVIAENPVTTGLLEIQKTIEAKDYAKASADLKRLSAEFPGEPRIYYNIGRVFALMAESVTDPDELSQRLLDAKVAYSNVLKTAKPTTDRALLSLTYVALAHIYEFADDDNTAVALYDKAIEINDVAGGAYREAIAGKQKLLKKP